MEYILYCDESADKGKKFGDFYGGCIVASRDLADAVDALEQKKRELNLFGEVKWTKVTDQYLAKYEELMHCFFRFVKEGKVKVRIMFRSMDDVYHPAADHSGDEKYFKLYYQFLKHAFGLRFIPDEGEPVYIRLYLDNIPDAREKRVRFKQFLFDMQNTRDFDRSPLRIRRDDIAEVDSRDHVLLQCTDIVLGAMHFRLNELHKAIPEGKSRRGKKTVAKEKLYQCIYGEISSFMPRFNIGVSTGARACENFHWSHPYAHWRFVPK